MPRKEEIVGLFQPRVPYLRSSVPKLQFAMAPCLMASLPEGCGPKIHCKQRRMGSNPIADVHVNSLWECKQT
jgi:hypothetical protein